MRIPFFGRRKPEPWTPGQIEYLRSGMGMSARRCLCVGVNSCDLVRFRRRCHRATVHLTSNGTILM